MGPAFIAAIGYIDPGNFATNIQAGASFGYQLLWVVVAVAFQEVDNTPHCETGTEGDNERLKNRDSLIEESHRFSSLI